MKPTTATGEVTIISPGDRTTNTQADQPTSPAKDGRQALGRPIAVGLGVSAVMLTAWLIYSRGIESQRRVAAFQVPVKQDTSWIDVPGAKSRLSSTGLRPGEVALTIRGPAGRMIRVATTRAELERHERELLYLLKRCETEAASEFRAAIAKVFDAAFADGEARLNQYADWFFEWKRSWILMKEAVVAGGSEITNIFSPSKIWDAVKVRLQTYLMDNYQERVLRPQVRDKDIRERLGAAFRLAHKRFLGTVAELDRRERAFLARQTRLLEVLPRDAVAIKLDWQAQKWKIPAHLAEDRAEDAYRSVAIMGGAVALGPLLQPILRRVSQRIMARVAGRVAVANGGKIFGAYLGVETFGASLVIGAVTDYVINLVDEQLSRENFVAEHRAALNETRRGWERLARDQLTPVVSRWYADTQQAIVRKGDGDK